MTLHRVKLGHAITFMKYLASVVFYQKPLIWNKITFPASNLVENELGKSISKTFYQYFFSIQFIAAYCKDLKSL